MVPSGSSNLYQRSRSVLHPRTAMGHHNRTRRDTADPGSQPQIHNASYTSYAWGVAIQVGILFQLGTLQPTTQRCINSTNCRTWEAKMSVGAGKHVDETVEQQARIVICTHLRWQPLIIWMPCQLLHSSSCHYHCIYVVMMQPCPPTRNGIAMPARWADMQASW